MARVVLATNNPGKVAELRAILGGDSLKLISASDLGGLPDVEETADTFEENAIAKALEASRHTGLAAIADDSGLEVDALGGAPGVRSARYAGESQDDAANVARLLGELEGVTEAERTARFVCVAAYVDTDGRRLTARGTCEGRIGLEPRGTRGFGYDPVFVPDGYEQTMAELSAETKNSISHRGKAFRALREQLRHAGVLD